MTEPTPPPAAPPEGSEDDSNVVEEEEETLEEDSEYEEEEIDEDEETLEEEEVVDQEEEVEDYEEEEVIEDEDYEDAMDEEEVTVEEEVVDQEEEEVMEEEEVVEEEVQVEEEEESESSSEEESSDSEDGSLSSSSSSEEDEDEEEGEQQQQQQIQEIKQEEFVVSPYDDGRGAVAAAEEEEEVVYNVVQPDFDRTMQQQQQEDLAPVEQHHQGHQQQQQQQQQQFFRDVDNTDGDEEEEYGVVSPVMVGGSFDSGQLSPPPPEQRLQQKQAKQDPPPTGSRPRRFGGTGPVDGDELTHPEDESTGLRYDVEEGMSSIEEMQTINEEKNKRRCLPYVDIVLIGLIVACVVVLATVIPLVLVPNLNKDKGGVPTDPPVTPSSPPQPTPPSSSTPSPVQTPPPAVIPTSPPATLPPGTTATPTIAATEPKNYVVTGGPFIGEPGSLLGSSVSMLGNVAVAGSPGASADSAITGSVTTFTRSSPDESWVEANEQLFGDQAGMLFGSSVDLSNTAGMVVGSPGAFALDTSVATGAAYFYEIIDTASSVWAQLGSTIRGTEDIDAFDENFGASVAVSDTRRVVVGAPNRNTGTGGVYTFEYNENAGTWDAMTLEPVAPTILSNEQYGTAVDISSDGKRVVIGAPGAQGNNGKFSILQWNEADSEWLELLSTEGQSAERFGTSVAFISQSGDTLAVGAPSATPGGLIRVYRVKEGTLMFEQVGPDIVGEAGESIGETGSIHGSSTTDKMKLAVGTANGLIRQFELDEGENSWLQPNGVIDSGSPSAVSSVYTEDGTKNLVAGVPSSDTVVIVRGSSSPDPPPPPPTAAPTTAAAPTVPPAAPTKTPTTIAPTTPPIAITPSWTQEGGPFEGVTGTANLGVSVAMVSSIVAAGSNSGNGFVDIYEEVGNEWTSIQTFPGSQENGLFGNSVDVNPSDQGILVGAPGTFAEGTNIVTGAAYYYVRFGATWTRQGSAIRGDTTAFTADELFGYSVAVSANKVVVAGAPYNNEDNVLARGKVYTFTYDSGTSSWALLGSLLGEQVTDLLGSSVDVSADGTTLIAGAPGRNSGTGAFFVYQLQGGSDWERVFSFGDATPNEGLGTSVTVLADDGSVIAAGGVGYDGGRGIIRVFHKQGGTYAPLGNLIVGSTTNDGLGSTNGISGSTATTTSIIASAGAGIVRTYTYNSIADSWDEMVGALSTGLSETPAVSGSTALGNFVAGADNQIQIYSIS